jgi:hypothetical protein
VKLSVSGEKGGAVSAGKSVKLSAQGNLLCNLDDGKKQTEIADFLIPTHDVQYGMQLSDPCLARGSI